MNASVIGYIILGLILALAISIMFQSKKRSYYKVYLANNDIKLLYRDFRERWWRTSDRYMRFKDEHDKEITFPSGAHWVLMMEEVDENELDIVRDEIRHEKEDRAEAGMIQ